MGKITFNVFFVPVMFTFKRGNTPFLEYRNAKTNYIWNVFRQALETKG